MALVNWSTTAANNASVDSINFAEGQAPSTLNNSARELMAQVRAGAKIRVATVAAMTAILKASVSNGDVVGVDNYTTAGDGGGGTFYWDEGATDTADDGLIFASDEGGAGRWKRNLCGQEITTAMYGVVGDGVANDYDAIMRVHDNAPDGAKILVVGALRYTTQPLVFTRRLNWWCEGLNNYFKPALTTLQDALTITGSASTSPMDCKINMFSGVGTCQNGLVLRNYNNSRMVANVAVGGSAYAYKLLGCLISDFDLISSVNYTTPLGSADNCPNHLYVDAYGGIYNNRNNIHVNFEGKTLGIIIADQSQQGNSTFSGTIEGLSGTPFSATGCAGMNVRELHMESCPTVSAFTSCSNLNIDNVLSASCGAWEFTTCTGLNIDNFSGGLTITSGCKFVNLGANIRVDGDAITVSNDSTRAERGVVTTSSSSYLLAPAGGASMENFFHNPLCDMYTGASTVPVGFAAVSATFAKDITTYYGGNPRAMSIAVTATATALADMTKATPTNPWVSTDDARWVAIMTPVYVATGQPDLRVGVWNGTTTVFAADVTTKDTWSVVRLVVLIDAGATPYVTYAPYNAGYAAGNFKIGGLSMVNGLNAPSALSVGGAYYNFVMTDVGYDPAFKGQRAYVSGTGKWYLAKDRTAAADWILLN